MSTEEDRQRGARLRQARKLKEYATAADAAAVLGISPNTYRLHENGNRGFKLEAERYATFYRVNFEWLWTGRGEMRPTKGEPPEKSDSDFAEAFSRAPAWAQRIIEGVLKEALSVTEDEKRGLSASDGPYEQGDVAPAGALQERPQRLPGAPGDKPKAVIDLKAIDKAVEHLPKGRAKRKPPAPKPIPAKRKPAFHSPAATPYRRELDEEASTFDSSPIQDAPKGLGPKARGKRK